MKLLLGQIVAAVDGKVIAKLEECSPPWSERIHCAKLTEAVLAEYQRYVKAHHAAVVKYGLPGQDAQGKNVIMVMHPDNPAAQVQAFNDALLDLLATEVELPVQPLSAAKLGESLTLNIGDVRLLGPLLGE